ncbi:hypothetical protein CHS0354_024732 [Potamilus streckersoni]|uniref:Uncharacterized protein n=1 Tax=Potamilus streckersoni TaxID=2493646 RepID=A0AAE0RX05_9BIVA|nr:hypothetical protein CHS0354_024732 [Potamilus streckersoni]
MVLNSLLRYCGLAEIASGANRIEEHAATSREATVKKIQLRWQGTSPGWRIIACQRSHSMVSCPLITVIEGYLERDIKTPCQKTLTNCSIDHRRWTPQAADSESWRRAVHQLGVKKMAKKEQGNIVSTHKNPDLPLQPLWVDVPVTFWDRQPPARLQQNWTSFFLNLRKQKSSQ